METIHLDDVSSRPVHFDSPLRTRRGVLLRVVNRVTENQFGRPTASIHRCGRSDRNRPARRLARGVLNVQRPLAGSGFKVDLAPPAPGRRTPMPPPEREEPCAHAVRSEFDMAGADCRPVCLRRRRDAIRTNNRPFRRPIDPFCRSRAKILQNVKVKAMMKTGVKAPIIFYAVTRIPLRHRRNHTACRRPRGWILSCGGPGCGNRRSEIRGRQGAASAGAGRVAGECAGRQRRISPPGGLPSANPSGCHRGGGRSTSKLCLHRSRAM